MRTLVFVMRWLAVLPGAAVAALLLSFPVRWLAVLFQFLPDSGESIVTNANGQSVLKTMPLDDLERLGMAAFAPAVMILAAGYIAPRYKFGVASSLAAIIAAFMVIAVVTIKRSATMQLTSGSVPEWLMFLLWAVSVPAGVYGAWSLWKRVPDASV